MQELQQDLQKIWADSVTSFTCVGAMLAAGKKGLPSHQVAMASLVMTCAAVCSAASLHFLGWHQINTYH